MNRGTIIKVEHLRKTYGEVVAVDDISFEVYDGEIFGMVGPNGAGKTTTIECIEGLKVADNGTIRVWDLDPQRDRYKLKERIGVQLQESALPDRIKVGEAIDLFASFYRKPLNRKEQAQLLEFLGLAEKLNSHFAKLSGGQKKRLFIALALVNNPQLIFLDELTTGLDPHARRAMWEMVRDIREKGKTVFLTTHYMEEAERLCDRVLIIDYGKIIALDTPEKLIQSLSVENRVTFVAEGEFTLELLQALPNVTQVKKVGERIIVYGKGDRFMSSVVNALEAQRVRFRDLRTEQPTLEDVFLTLTHREYA